MERISIKNSLPYMNVCSLSCVVHGPIYGRFMGCTVNGPLSIYKVIPGSTSRNSWLGCAALFSKSWPYFRPKSVIFLTRSQTWPLGRNYVIITQIRVQTKMFFQSISNSHIPLSFLLIWNIETINTFMHSRSFLENHIRFQTKMSKVYSYPFSD